MVAPKPTESMRADARQNRDRILDVALAAFTAVGDASLNSIAKQAGVGIGTLYRHFPTRETLVLAVYRHEVEQLVDAAPVLLADRPPIEALRAWLDRLADYGMTKAGLADAISAATISADGLAAETHDPVRDALSTLLIAGEQAGVVRAGLDPDDVLLILGFLSRIDPKGEWRPRAGRLLDLLVDGLRAV